MKTKEITVWVDPDEVVNDAWTLCHADFYKGELTGMVKARLIIDLPEKKISITESEFDLECRKVSGSLFELGPTDKLLILKKKLFGG